MNETERAIRTAVQELTTKLEGFPMDQFLADVAAIGDAARENFNRLFNP